tara:strand:- start:229 stop:483 length:255 start_codon:yes stop_codon:yes gene_type:complete
MKKNDNTLSVDDIEKRKEMLQTDMKQVQKQLEQTERMKIQLTAQHNALNGAIQQCDSFIEQLSGANNVSSIPSQDDSAVTTALS